MMKVKAGIAVLLCLLALAVFCQASGLQKTTIKKGNCAVKAENGDKVKVSQGFESDSPCFFLGSHMVIKVTIVY